MSDSSVNFRTVLRGYDPAQVDHHMNQLAQAAASVWQESAERTRQINELKAANGQLTRDLEAHVQRTRELEAAQQEAAEPTYTGLGERIGAVLTMVDNEVYELRARAEANAANSLALAEEHASAIRQDADVYARGTRGAADDDVSVILEEARQQADNLLEEARQQADNLLEEARYQADNLLEEADRQTMARQDADRQAMVRREEAESVYEQARAKSAAAAIDFETTLAKRREASALEFAAQVTAAEHQLASVRLRSEQTRSEAERLQQETATKVAQQLEQASIRAKALVAEARTKADRIRDNAEREVAAATQRRDTINAQLNTVRRDLAALGGARKVNPPPTEEPAADQNGAAEVERVMAEAQTDDQAGA